MEVVAIDCEMVGAGPRGSRSMLARVSMVDSDGDVLLDTYVAPSERVTDYRTTWSGVQPHHLAGAPSFVRVQDTVVELMEGKVLVGHDLDHDLQALQLRCPWDMLRDTARFRPLMQYRNGVWRPCSLKRLAQEELGWNIQQGSHDSVVDARAALALYQRYAARWERELVQPQPQPRRHGLMGVPRPQPRMHGLMGVSWRDLENDDDMYDFLYERAEALFGDENEGPDWFD